jgi:hypothetical protein
LQAEGGGGYPAAFFFWCARQGALIGIRAATRERQTQAARK